MQELIGDEIIDETDQWTSNTQTARVNAATLTEQLPSNLRTLVALGLFMPRVHPSRSRTPSALASSSFEHASLPGTPAAAKAATVAHPVPAADGLPGTSVSGNVPDSAVASQRSPVESMRGGVHSEAATAASDSVAEASAFMEEEGAAVPPLVPFRRTTSVQSTSFLLAKKGRGQSIHAKDRVAQVVLRASDGGASS